MTDDRRQYLTNGELREEISYVVGGDPTRYGPAIRRGLTKPERLAVAREVTDRDDLERLTAVELAECIGDALDVEPRLTQNDWKCKRDLLKAIHAAVDGEDPRAVVDA